MKSRFLYFRPAFKMLRTNQSQKTSFFEEGELILSSNLILRLRLKKKANFMNRKFTLPSVKTNKQTNKPKTNKSLGPGVNSAERNKNKAKQNKNKTQPNLRDWKLILPNVTTSVKTHRRFELRYLT